MLLLLFLLVLCILCTMDLESEIQDIIIIIIAAIQIPIDLKKMVCVSIGGKLAHELDSSNLTYTGCFK